MATDNELTGRALGDAIEAALDRLHPGLFRRAEQVGAMVGWFAHVAPTCGRLFLADLERQGRR